MTTATTATTELLTSFYATVTWLRGLSPATRLLLFIAFTASVVLPAAAFTAQYPWPAAVFFVTLLLWVNSLVYWGQVAAVAYVRARAHEAEVQAIGIFLRQLAPTIANIIKPLTPAAPSVPKPLNPGPSFEENWRSFVRLVNAGTSQTRSASTSPIELDESDVTPAPAPAPTSFASASAPAPALASVLVPTASTRSPTRSAPAKPASVPALVPAPAPAHTVAASDMDEVANVLQALRQA